MCPLVEGKEDLTVMERYICVHGHFYQPPRENSWLEAIELQDSAYPYHDWNERITAECYATNATSRILDGEGWIVEIVNNYANISFNFGPTLLAWLEVYAPDVYQAVVEADRLSQERFSGHGSALAQAYNHMILPLANHRDKFSQIFWGIRDFEKRFGRYPEGMWLPETAVDLASLDILAERGIRFTILAPHQASRVKAVESEEWQDVKGGKIDPTMPYSLWLPSGRTIDLFFYDGPISRAVAFEGLLSSGESLAQRLLDGFAQKASRPQLVHIATDGETYGHHHPFGDMALAYALHHVQANKLAKLTNYGEFLELHPPTHQVEIFENTSWSCAHGIKRWWSDCGCKTGGQPGWNQAWRTPLREALDWLRDTLAPLYEQRAGELLQDPWRARNDYIEVIPDRSTPNVERFFGEQGVRPLTTEEKITGLKLLELQRHTMLMYTSCGWFFDELSGIETVQVIQYAGRALQLSKEVFNQDLEPHFLELLARAKSNLAEHRDGQLIYQKFVKPAAVDLKNVCAHYAVSSLFQDYGEQARVFCYQATQENYDIQETGKAKLALGRTRLTSEITGESARFSFGVLHWGDHNFSCSVTSCGEEEPSKPALEAVSESFTRADFTKTFRLLEEHFGPSTYSLRSLFRDEKRKILDIILQSTLIDAEASYRQLYEYNAPLLRFVTSLGNPPPDFLHYAANFVLNLSLKRAFESETLDLEHIEDLLNEASLAGVSIDAPALEMVIRKKIEGFALLLFKSIEDIFMLQELEAIITLLDHLPFKVNIWKLQNICFQLLNSQNFIDLQEKTSQGQDEAGQVVERFTRLCEKLHIRTS
jgi:alpha-amylase/alpha-mannosidase (GH57 family)